MEYYATMKIMKLEPYGINSKKNFKTMLNKKKVLYKRLYKWNHTSKIQKQI